MKRDGYLFLTALGALLLTSAGVRAVTHAEVGDAGELPATAQATSGAPLNFITGEITSATDVDMYLIKVVGPFSATTVGQPGTLIDTQLFLFDLNGLGVWSNDDASGPEYRSTISDANLAPGCYYLAIAGYNRDPVSSGGLIFIDNAPFGSLQGPDGPGGASAIIGWSGDTITSGIGTYTIELSGVEGCEGVDLAIPEPLTAGLGLLGLAALALKRTSRT